MAFGPTSLTSGQGAVDPRYQQFVQQLMQQFPGLGQLAGRPAGPGATLHDWGYDPSGTSPYGDVQSQGQFQPLTMFEGAAQPGAESISGSLAMGGQGRGASIGRGMPGGIPLQQVPSFIQPQTGGGFQFAGSLTGGPTQPMQSTQTQSSGRQFNQQPWWSGFEATGQGGGGTSTGTGMGSGMAGPSSPDVTIGTASPAFGALDVQSGNLAKSFFGALAGSFGIPGAGMLAGKGVDALSSMAPMQTIDANFAPVGASLQDVAPNAIGSINLGQGRYAPVYSESYTPSFQDFALNQALSLMAGGVPGATGLLSAIRGLGDVFAGTQSPQPMNVANMAVLNALQDPLFAQQYPAEVQQMYAPIAALLAQNPAALQMGNTPLSQATAGQQSVEGIMGALGQAAAGRGMTTAQAEGLGAGSLGKGALSLGQLQNELGKLGIPATPEALSAYSQVQTIPGLMNFLAQYLGAAPGTPGMADVGLQAEEAGIAESGLAGPTPTSAPPGMVSGGWASEADAAAAAAEAAAQAAATQEGMMGGTGVGAPGGEMGDVGLGAESAGISEGGLAGPGPEGVAGDTGGVGPEGGEW